MSSFKVEFDTANQPLLNPSKLTYMTNYNGVTDCICGEVTYTVTNSPLPSYITNPMYQGKFSLAASDVYGASDTQSEVVSLSFTVEWAYPDI